MNKLFQKLSSMNKNTLGMLICGVLIVLALVIFVFVRSNKNSSDPPSQLKTETELEVDSTNPVEAYTEIGDSDTSKVVTNEKKQNGSWTTMNDEEYDISITRVEGGYSGPFVEDGSDESVKKCLALVFTNNSEQDIQYAEYVYEIEGDAARFKLSNLPAGQSCLVLEVSRHEYGKKERLSLVSRVVAKVDTLPYARDEVLVVDNDDNTITIMNLTEKDLPVVRVFYKEYDFDNNWFVGGITYTAKVESVPAGSGVTVTPEHYHSGLSAVVGSGVYESDS